MFSFCVDHRTLSFKMKKKIPPICRIGFLKKEFSSVWNVWRAKQWNSIVRAHFLRWFVERGCHFIHGQTGGSCLAIMPRYQHFASLHVAVNRKHLVLEISRNSWMHLEIVRDRNCSRGVEKSRISIPPEKLLFIDQRAFVPLFFEFLLSFFSTFHVDKSWRQMEHHFSCTVFFDLKDLPKISHYFCYTVFVFLHLTEVCFFFVLYDSPSFFSFVFLD